MEDGKADTGHLGEGRRRKLPRPLPRPVPVLRHRHALTPAHLLAESVSAWFDRKQRLFASLQNH